METKYTGREYKSKHTGKWGFYVRYFSGKHDASGKEIWKVKRRESKAWNRNDAKRALKEFLKTAHIQDQIKTFGDLYDAFYDHKSTRVRPSTLRDIQSTYTTHIKDTFEHTPLSQLSDYQVKVFQKSLLKKTIDEKPYRNATIQKIQTYLFAMIRFGVKERHINNYGLTQIDRVRIEELPYEANYIDFEDYSKFINSIDNIETRIIFSMLYHTGLRKAELIGLTFKDVDIDRKIIRVDKQFDSKDMLIVPVKSRNSNRSIVIPQVLLDDITEYLESLEGLKLSPEDRFIVAFTSYTELDRLKAKTFDNSPIEEITFHEFRHSHCSTLISAGFSEFEIAERLGDTVDTVLKVYAHLLQSRKTEMMDKYDELYNNIS